MKPHPKNAAGPFYVEDDCCLSCGATHYYAPDLFEFDQNQHCFVIRQPKTEDELNRMMRAVWGAEVSCVRYGGSDPEIRRRLAEMDVAHVCDSSPPPGVDPLLRNHVTFDIIVSGALAPSPRDLALSFQKFVDATDGRPEGDESKARYASSELEDVSGGVKFSICWYEGLWYPVMFSRITGDGARWLVNHSPQEDIGSRGLSVRIEEWLLADGRYYGFRWYTEADWKRSGPWRISPLQRTGRVVCRCGCVTRIGNLR
jgi:ferredoxin